MTRYVRGHGRHVVAAGFSGQGPVQEIAAGIGHAGRGRADDGEVVEPVDVQACAGEMVTVKADGS